MPEHEPQPDEQLLGELAALADGTIAAERRPELERLVAESPELSAELEHQRAALAAIAGANAEVHAPAALRQRIESAPEPRRPSPSQPSTWRRWQLLGGLAAVTAAVLLAVVALPAAEPTVADAAALASLPSDAPAPEPVPGDPALLAADVEGVAYPNWEREFEWRASGERSDDLDGREARTVFYEKEGNRLGYTIVSGEAIAPPDGEVTTVDGVEFTSFEQDGKDAVTWLRDGRTCVLVAAGVEHATLVELAAWRGDGAVGF